MPTVVAIVPIPMAVDIVVVRAMFRAPSLAPEVGPKAARIIGDNIRARPTDSAARHIAFV